MDQETSGTSPFKSEPPRSPDDPKDLGRVLPRRWRCLRLVPVQRLHDRDARRHFRPLRSATSSSVSIAICQSAASRTAFGNPVMYVAASRSVFSLRPSGRMIGSTNRADHGTSRCPCSAGENFGRTSAPRLPQAVQHKAWLNIRQPRSVVGPAVGTDLDMVAASVIAAIDQQSGDGPRHRAVSRTFFRSPWGCCGDGSGIGRFMSIAASIQLAMAFCALVNACSGVSPSDRQPGRCRHHGEIAAAVALGKRAKQYRVIRRLAHGCSLTMLMKPTSARIYTGFMGRLEGMVRMWTMRGCDTL